MRLRNLNDSFAFHIFTSSLLFSFLFLLARSLARSFPLSRQIETRNSEMRLKSDTTFASAEWKVSVFLNLFGISNSNARLCLSKVTVRVIIIRYHVECLSTWVGFDCDSSSDKVKNKETALWIRGALLVYRQYVMFNWKYDSSWWLVKISGNWLTFISIKLTAIPQS